MTYFGESAFDNDHAVFELSRADRQAGQGWRFRHHKGAAARILISARAGFKRLIQKALGTGKPSLAFMRKRPPCKNQEGVLRSEYSA